MPCWYYDKKELRHSPSINQGISVEDEVMYRREGARFILQLGNKMGLRYETMATGVVYFHRFYMIHSFQEFPRHVTACCCLFLAGKVEETPKKCKDIMKHARSQVDDATWAEFGTDPREEVMTLERIILQTIKFDFIVEHPYTYLLKYAKCLKGDKKKLQNMVQMAWTFVNDGLCTTLCLQWEPEIIAIALMYLAGKLNKFEVVDWQGRSSKHQKWWDMFVQGISMELLEDICHQVLDLYSPHKTEGGAAGGIALSAPAGLVAATKGERPTAETATVAAATTPKQAEGTTKSAAPPPTKKVKKEEAKLASPAKTEAPTKTTQPYQYPSTFPPAYAPNYPPPPTTTSNVISGPSRYSYPYSSTTNQHPPTPQPGGTISHLTPPTTYQPPPSNRYQNSTTTTSSVPPTGQHYPAQAPPPTQYSTSHPPPYPPPSGGGAPHYPPPSSQHRPSFYSQGAPPPGNTYYPPQPPSMPPGNIQQGYQQPPSNSYAPPPSANYPHSSRQYYPPST